MLLLPVHFATAVAEAIRASARGSSPPAFVNEKEVQCEARFGRAVQDGRRPHGVVVVRLVHANGHATPSLRGR